MRILFLATNFPLPMTNGQAIRTFSLVEVLARKHELFLVSFATPDQFKHLPLLEAKCRRIELIKKKPTSLSTKLNIVPRGVALLNRKPFGIARYRSSEFARRVRDILSRERIDLIFLDSVYAAANLPRTKLPIVLNTHNVESVILRRYADLEGNLVKRAYAKMEARLMDLEESRAAKISSVVLACSENDAHLLRDLGAPATRICVVPNCIDTHLYAEIEQHDSKNDTILFQGGLDWFPNRDAVHYFILDILPHVQTAVPTASFVIAGRNPPEAFKQQFAATQGVTFTGTVPDMRHYLREASVVVVPLRIGSGTRLKIIEAAAAGKPIISSRIGAEGLEFAFDREILIADNASEFAKAVSELLLNRGRQQAIGEAARRKAMATYDLINLERALGAALSTVTSDPIRT